MRGLHTQTGYPESLRYGTTIKRHGGALGERLDDGLSAWKIGVRRPSFEKLHKRASTGESLGTAVWHVDRSTEGST